MHDRTVESNASTAFSFSGFLHISIYAFATLLNPDLNEPSKLQMNPFKCFQRLQGFQYIANVLHKWNIIKSSIQFIEITVCLPDFRKERDSIKETIIPVR